MTKHNLERGLILHGVMSSATNLVCRAFDLLAPAICTLRASRLCRSALAGSAL